MASTSATKTTSGGTSTNGSSSSSRKSELSKKTNQVRTKPKPLVPPMKTMPNQISNTGADPLARRDISNYDQKKTATFAKGQSEINEMDPEGMKDQIASELNRKKQLRQKQQQAKIGTPQSALPQAPDSKTDEDNQEQEEQGEQEIKKQGIIDTLQARLAKAKKDYAVQEESGLADEAKEKTRAEVKKAAKKAAKSVIIRGTTFLVTGIAGVIDVGTAGISLIVDFLVYAFSLGWLNLELFYGRLLRKDKDPFISALSYAPIPMPVDPKANILAGAVIAADIAVVLMLLVTFTFTLLIMISVVIPPFAMVGIIATSYPGIFKELLSIFKTIF